MNVLKKLMQRLCGYGKHDDREHGELLTAQLRLGPADILESDENGIIPEQARVITQVVILDADKKQITTLIRAVGPHTGVRQHDATGKQRPVRLGRCGQHKRGRHGRQL
ncbi:TPA: phage tail fiber C-terminal domain-containing protein [Escherichia coli]